MDQKNLPGNGRFPNAIQRCGERYIHMTVLKASYRVMLVGLGGKVVDRPLRSIIVNWTCIQCARLRAVRLLSVIQNMLKKHDGR